MPEHLTGCGNHSDKYVCTNHELTDRQDLATIKLRVSELPVVSQTHQSATFNDRLGVYFVNVGSRYALRDSRAKALLYAYEAALHGNNPISIVNLGQSERLDPHAILQRGENSTFPPLADTLA
jgi:hypothetical protein